MSSKHKDLGVSAYQPIRTKAHGNMIMGTEADLMNGMAMSGAKHQPQNTKPQFKKRRNRHGHVKIIRIR